MICKENTLTRRTKIHEEWTTYELNSTKDANMKKLNRGEHTEAKKETRNIHDAYIPAPKDKSILPNPYKWARNLNMKTNYIKQ